MIEFNITRKEVEDVLEKDVSNGLISVMIKNRLVLILEKFNNVTTFLNTSHTCLLNTFRSMGFSQKKDFGKKTYDEFDRIVKHFKDDRFNKLKEAKIEENRKKVEEEKAKKLNPSFTKDQLLAIATFMDTAKAESVDLIQLNNLIGCFKF